MTEPFSSNKGSPKGDALIGLLFNLYFEESLQKSKDFQHEMNSNDDKESGYRPQAFLSQEAIYAGTHSPMEDSQKSWFSFGGPRRYTKKKTGINSIHK